jgi:hypothetical protein
MIRFQSESAIHTSSISPEELWSIWSAQLSIFKQGYSKVHTFRRSISLDCQLPPSEKPFISTVPLAKRSEGEKT